MNRIIQVLLSTMIIPSITYASEMLITFSDTIERQSVIQVTKSDSERIFKQCQINEEEVVLASCVEIDRVSVKKYDETKGMLSSGEIFSTEAIPEILGGVVGGIAGFRIGSTVEMGVSLPRREATVSKRASLGVWVVFTVGGTVTGYFLGDILDGREFSAIETASIRSAIVREEILSEESDKDLDLNISLDAYRDALRRASIALFVRD